MGNETTVVDRILGPSELRYFGSGHRNSRYELEGIEVGGDHDLKCRGTVHQLGSWSSKNGEQRARHLSSIDALVLGLMVTESLLRMGEDVSPTGHDLDDYQLTGFSLHAGTHPVPAEGVPLAGKMSTTRDGCLSVSIKCGGIKEKLQFLSPISNCGVAGEPSHRGECARAVPFMPNHLQHRIQVFHRCDLADDGKSASMSADLIRTDEVNFTGLGSGHSLSPSLLEYILVWAQLIEIMAYNYDNVSRDKCGNFWMRSVEIGTNGRLLPARRTDLDFVAYFTKSRLLNVAGSSFRVLSMEGNSAEGAISGKASVAHALPSRNSAEGAVNHDG